MLEKVSEVCPKKFEDFPKGTKFCPFRFDPFCNACLTPNLVVGSGVERCGGVRGSSGAPPTHFGGGVYIMYMTESPGARGQAPPYGKPGQYPCTNGRNLRPKKVIYSAFRGERVVGRRGPAPGGHPAPEGQPGVTRRWTR